MNKEKNNSIQAGDFVRVHANNPKFEYMNKDFKKWIMEHKDKKFYVEKVNNNTYKLAKVHFVITEHFVEKY